MATNSKIWIALAITVVMVFAAVWQIANVRGMKARGRRRTVPLPDPKGQQRRSDKVNLSGQEKRLYNEAQKLLAQNKIPPASRILEQLGMQREAIQVLEDHGMIHDAAKILMRMQRHNRAGVIYARHGMWENAAQCFKMANMPLEVAKCSREAGDLRMAAEYFEKVGRYEDAGECYEQMGDYLHAARLFSNVGEKQKAMAMYNRLAAAVENLAAIEFQEQELQQIVDYLGDGHTDQGLAAVAVNRNKLTEVILSLVGKELTKQAAALYLRAASDLGPMLMAEVNYQTSAAGCLAEVFTEVSAFHYAGMVFERMSRFDRAAEAFEEAEDFERAAYCYERAGIDGKVKALKEKARLTPYRGKSAGSSFALSDVATKHEGGAFASSDGDEATAMLDPNRAVRAPVPSPNRGAFRLGAGDDTLGKRAQQAAAAGDEPPSPPPPPPPRPVPASAAAPQPAHGSAAPPGPAGDAAEPGAAATDGREGQGQGDGDGESTPVQLEVGRAAFHRARFFADLDFDQKNRLWDIGDSLSFDAEETILTYNDEPQGVYVIVQGSVSCYKQVGGKEAYVDQMGEAESFGELWLLADQPTAVRFVASKNTSIRVVNRDAFNDLLDRDGTIARKLYKRFTMRLLKRLLKPQNNTRSQAAS